VGRLGNVQCLDVLRALSKEPGVLDVLFNELGDGHGDKRLAAHINRLQAAFKDTSDIQYRARQLTEDIALGCRPSCCWRRAMRRSAMPLSPAVWFRRPGIWRVAAGLDVEAIVARSTPQGF
jgi:putative acyl-CoA dehydrogenase